MTTVVCPGSFDPVHNGHLDIFERAAARFDQVVVAVVVNPAKAGFFTVPERVELITSVTAHLPNVSTASFEGLLVDFCNARDIGVICKGVRGIADFEYEAQMATMNTQIGEVETVFLTTNPAWGHVSSSLVRQIAQLDGDIDGSVPLVVATALRERVSQA